MKKAPVIITSLVVILVLVGLGMYFLSRQQPAVTSPAMSGMSQQSQGQTQNTQPATPNEVGIQNFAFSPASVTVKKGTTIKWTNNDAASHTVVENDDKNGPNSPPLAKSQTYLFTFNETGTFAYKCSIHPSMTGSVTVTE